MRFEDGAWGCSEDWEGVNISEWCDKDYKVGDHIIWGV